MAGMNHQDATISDVVVIVDGKWSDRTDQAVQRMKETGLRVEQWNDNSGVVEGNIDAAKVGELEKLDCVDYVRKVFTYIADYPAGDPRDLDAELDGEEVG